MRIAVRFAVVALVALAALVPAGAQASQVVRMPVSGSVAEPAPGGQPGSVSYTGALYLIWTPAAGEGNWRVTEILVADAQSPGTGTGFAIQGFSEERVSGSPGSALQLAPAFLVSGLAGGLPYRVTPTIAAIVPLAGSTPSASAVASKAETIPVSGTYYEPAIRSNVTYRGDLHLVWKPSSSPPDWTLSSVMVVDAVSAAGPTYKYFAAGEDSFTLTPGATAELATGFWAIGSGTGFTGRLGILVTLPAEMEFPQVQTLALASR